MPDETGAREVAAPPEFMLRDESTGLPKLRGELGMLGRDWFEVPGLIALLELVGSCTDRDWLGGLTTLGGVRLIGAEFVRPMDG